MAATVHSLAANNFGFNWFDMVVIAVLGFGIFRGRKNGMSKELIPFTQWLAMILVAGFFYQPLGDLLSKTASLDALDSYFMTYIGLMLVVIFVFSFVKRLLAPKMESSNLFGNSEYYIGMLAGMVRFTCILVMALALLNARHYSKQEILNHQREDADVYGGGMYSGDYFPTVQSVQAQVFKKSFLGPRITQYLGDLLIKPTEPGNGPNAKPEQKKQPIIHIGN
jgi:uncharacterized membrane protein required for colicin V production